MSVPPCTIVAFIIQFFEDVYYLYFSEKLLYTFLYVSATGEEGDFLKSSTIGRYIARQQRILYSSIISAVFLLTALVLFLSTRYRIENTAREQQTLVIHYMDQFFDTYRQRSIIYDQNQEIRNLLRYAADSRKQGNQGIESDLDLPSDVSLYVNGSFIYPGAEDSGFLAEELDSIDRETLLYQKGQLYYLVPYYNFTQSRQLGLICYKIIPRVLAEYCSGNIPLQLSFRLSDSRGNVFYQTENIHEDFSEYTFTTENFPFSGIIYMDSRSYYYSNLAFLAILLLGCAAGMVLSIYFSRSLSKKIVAPINQIVISLKRNQEGELTYVPVPTSNLQEIDQISSAYEEMLFRIRHLVEQNHKQNLLKAESELKVLQEKINPHFLFNTLELISSQAIMEDADKTAQLAQKLGSLFRYSLRMPDIIYLKQEIQYARDYLFLQNVRYNNRIRYHIEMSELLSQFLIPKLTLQPVLENCFKHGFKDETDRDHEIQITVHSVGESVFIAIEDNGSGISGEKAEELNKSIAMDLNDFSHFIQRGDHIGLRNVNARLCSYYEISNALTLHPLQPRGTRVSICLPCGPRSEKGSEPSCIEY